MHQAPSGARPAPRGGSLLRAERQGTERGPDFLQLPEVVLEPTGPPSHSVSVAEAEEVLLSRPVVRRMAKGHVRGEDVYAALAQVRNGRYLIVFFIDKKRA